MNELVDIGKAMRDCWVKKSSGNGTLVLWFLLLFAFPVGTLIALFGWKPDIDEWFECRHCGHRGGSSMPHHPGCRFYSDDPYFYEADYQRSVREAKEAQ